MARQTQPKKRTSKADATRRELLDAALAIITERGYSAATVDQIVEAAGVSKGVAYYHFSSKADIAQCLLVEGVDTLCSSFQQVVGEMPTATEALMAMVEVFASFIFQNPAFGRFFVSELWREGRAWTGSMRQHEERLLAVLREQLVRGQREGTVRPEIDPAFEAVALVGMILTTTLYYIGEEGQALPDSERTQRQFITHIADFVHHANAPA